MCGVRILGSIPVSARPARSVRREWTVCLALASTVLMAACGPSSSPPDTAQSATMPTTAAYAPAKLEPRDCPDLPELADAQCWTMEVRANRITGQGTVRLPVARIPAEIQPAEPDPIVLLTGGPGNDAILDPPIPNGVGRNRDLILMSARGTLSAEPALTCPEIDAFYAERVGLVFGSPSTGSKNADAAKACYDRLSDSADLAAFNTVEMSYDLAELRAALEIDRWNIYSHSYGTDLALVYMRQDPQAIRSVTLDGVTPPSVAALGWTWASAREAFDNMTAACEAQPQCEAAYPDLADKFVDMVNKLEAQPITTTVDVHGRNTTVVLDGGTLLNWFVPMATHFPAEFPAAIYELAEGKPERIAQIWATVWTDPAKAGKFGWGLALSVWCSEWVPFETREDELRMAAEAFPTFPDSVREQAPQLPFLREICAVWRVPKAPDAIRDITTSDIPTLVLSGSYDGQTGARWGHYVAADLSRSTEVTVPGVAHGIYTDPCAAQIAVSFYENPLEPDTGCVSAVQPPPYAVNPPPP